MKAVRLYAAKDLRVETIDPPAHPEPGWARLKVTAAGICGSDLHNFMTGQWISRSPSVAGHEFAAIVTATGDGVTGFKPGDTVIADSRYWCGECPSCKSSRQNVCETLGFIGEVCDGGFAEETALPVRLLVHYDPAINPVVAAMGEPLSVALHAIRRQRMPSGEAVLVVGCGPIGGLAALLLSRLHDGPVLVCDRNDQRANLVSTVTGATAVPLDKAAIETAINGQPIRHAIDATGNIGVLMATLDVLSGGGSLALVGISHGRIELDPNILVEREISLIGCHAYQDELHEIARLLPDLEAQLLQLVDREIPLDEVPRAYARLIAGEANGLKTIIRPGM
ncbi:(R,R)-butanediol dehydrogenase/meso-butanediol dehydrogenase/diacetyl reductase [Ochrobactrum sp. RC6B]|uniref:Alcohol dehydrogenase catalytic domain-containing protein n=2 Tax=Brucella intermedia TaxID=94625 RepID=A0AA42GZA8_9HYPH|nr:MULTISPECIES: alcohol dehydrogenase catalytic domain-containing protein [Brucella/Ochrobactrum group]ERI15069.1 dehydrogenase [Ochrobactrum sp. EGD-AQ16]PJT21550.1 dehydrogenase [Ochrobactrum sp. 30A/1000/2015]PJT39846.1 dehydrogenase [Ochrobactrum sp. 27A/999/2015]PJT44139.1 dehydrogenase [Ochrobactrum sp. 23A/997/2015]KAB2695205.1 alcohol dehydrogenase catalytic domain-containing protein [Brucella intermedia]